MQEEKRNAAGGAENIWFYSEQLGKSYNVLLLIMLVETCTSLFCRRKNNINASKLLLLLLGFNALYVIIMLARIL